MDPHRLVAGSHQRPLKGLPNEDQLATALTALDEGPTRWVVDDLWAPSLLLRDAPEVPTDSEARTAFWKWRFNQSLGIEEDMAVQALQVEHGLWLLAGLPEAHKRAWTDLATQLGRPIHHLTPRWLAVYNHLAPEQSAPGLLASLAPHPDGGFTGTLAAWSHQLCLLRQWHEPLNAEAWQEERVLPTLAYLQREGRSPQGLYIFGTTRWGLTTLPTFFLPDNLLDGEVA